MGILLGWLLAATLALLSASASAQVPPIPPCIDSIALWTTPYSAGSIQSASYYPEILVLSVLHRGNNWQSVYVNVPQSIAQGLAAPATSADPYFNTHIQGRYLQALLSEFGCPLLAEATGSMLLAEMPGSGAVPTAPPPAAASFWLWHTHGFLLWNAHGKVECNAC